LPALPAPSTGLATGDQPIAMSGIFIAKQVGVGRPGLFDEMKAG
jgi:hypothetical protein